jgi:tetratricopeptide (TPR) repeat protein
MHDDKEVIVDESTSPEVVPETDSAPVPDAEPEVVSARLPIVERNGKVTGIAGLVADDGESVATYYVREMLEDADLGAGGSDAPVRLTAAGEALDLVLNEYDESEQHLRRAIRMDSGCGEAHESLRRLHRTSGNWRTVAQLLEQEIAGTECQARKAQLGLALDLLVRTRPDATSAPRFHGDTDLPEIYARVQTMLEATGALADRDVEKALALRESLGTPGEGQEMAPEHEEWRWSEANLRRFLLKDSSAALGLLNSLFDGGRRDTELLEALAELLTEHRDWERLRKVLETVVDGGDALNVHFEMLASLLEIRYRDIPAAAMVLGRGAAQFPEDITLARRLVEVLRVLGGEEDPQELIDALGNLVEVTAGVALKADLFFELGQLFEQGAARTSSAIEIFHQALAVDPHHGPTLRALGNIYIRQNNWYGLADLYEKELAAPDPLSDAWRRHFQLAEIYESRLDNRSAALRHYRAVLAVQPAFVPALHAVVRLFSEEGDWDDLVGLLHTVAGQVRSQRRQIHLLEEAARLCEERLDNDLLLREILEKLVDLDPESPRATAGLTRLYRRTRSWEHLIALFLREAGWAEDAEETATLFWQCGSLAAEELADSRRAEEFFRQSLSTVPDFLPSLESLCRLLAQERRFDDIVDLSEAELGVLEGEREKMRRMDAMADILQHRLSRRPAAVELVERMVEACPDEVYPLRRLASLYSVQGKWDLVAEIREKEATQLGSESGAAEVWCALGELRERKLADDVGALDAYAEALASDPNHPHAMRGALRTGISREQDLDPIMVRVDDNATDVDSRRLARRTRARWAEQQSGNPAAAWEIRQQALAENTIDRESRDMLEAAWAWKRNLPGLAGLWAAAGRSLDEGLMGLLGASAGIHSASLIGAFLDRWNDGLDGALQEGGRSEVWHAALQELSRQGVDALAKEERIAAPVWASLPDGVQRRIALAALAGPDGAAQACAILDRAPITDAATSRLRALLAAGDQRAFVSATKAEIRHMKGRDLKVKRLLELAAFDTDNGPDYLRQAVEEKTFESPIQEQLYDRLEEAGELELSRGALEDHLCIDDLSPRRRSFLAFRLGGVLSQLEADDEEILAAYRMSYESGRDRHEALTAMATVAERMGDVWESIRCIEAFLTLSTDVPSRIAAGLELAELYLSQWEPPEGDPGYDPYSGGAEIDITGPLGRKALDLLARLREEARETEFEAQVLSRMAHAVAKVGSPFQAVSLFQEVLQAGFVPEQLDDCLALSDLYAGPLGDPSSAEQILWTAVEICPDNEGLVERLLVASRRAGTLNQTTRNLERIARLAAPEVIDAARRRALLRQVADILGGEIGRFRQAAAIWDELADGAVGAEDQRLLRVRQAGVLSQVPGQEGECHSLLRKLQRQDPFDQEVYRGLETLYADLSDFSRLRVVQQVRYVIEPGVEPSQGAGRRKIQPGRIFEEEVVRLHMVPQGLQGGILEVLRALEPVASRVWSERLPAIDALGGRKWRSSDFGQVRDFAQLAAETFDLTKVKFHLGKAGPAKPQVIGNTIWYHTGMFEETSAEVARFLAGYGAGLAWSGVGSLVHLDGRDLWHLLEAVLIKQTGTGITPVTDPASMALVDKLSGPFTASLRRKVVDAATPCLDILRTAYCEAWPAMVEEIAVRAGLVLGGHLAGAVLAMLAGREWRGHLHDEPTQEYMRGVPEIGDLLRFCLDDDYFALRYGCGLDTKAPRIS